MNKPANKTTKLVNVSSVPMLSVFRYPGGKTWFVPTARKWLQSHEAVEVFVEPFAGGGIVGLTAIQEDLACKAVLADLDPNVSSVWVTMLDREDHRKLIDKIVSFEMDANNLSETWKRINEAKEIGFEKDSDTIDRAFATILTNRTNYGGIIASSAGKLKSGAGPLTRWYPATLAKRIANIQSMSERIAFLEADAFDVMDCYSGLKNIALFSDPPYTVTSKSQGARLYPYHDLSHEQLFRLASVGFDHVLMTYEDHPYVEALASQHKLHVRRVPMKSTKHVIMHELMVCKSFSWWDDAEETVQDDPNGSE